MSEQLKAMSRANLQYAEELYELFLTDPAAVPGEWRSYFEQNAPANGPISFGPSFSSGSLFHLPAGFGESVGGSVEERLHRYADHYRARGHRFATLSSFVRQDYASPELTTEFYGLSEEELSEPLAKEIVPGAKTGAETVERLRELYSGNIAAEFAHIDDYDKRMWLQERFERPEPALTADEKKEVLQKLTQAYVFEDFLQKRYLGHKSFSLEGGESLIPLVHSVIERSGPQGVKEVVFGMAHRGRLNILANIFDTPQRDLFAEFEDLNGEKMIGRGDVKYHLGGSSDHVTKTGETVHLSLTHNPSHLEVVNTVTQGRVRAKQDRAKDDARTGTMAFLLHGDAAFAGEGFAQETLNLAQLEGYRVGGTMHVITNNQIGFTTGPEQGRSTTYSSDIARMLQSPIFHVNGEDPEAVVRVARIAADYRAKFDDDVVIDLQIYRRYGHNETDEPMYTQPLMYTEIKARKSVWHNYAAKLVSEGVVTQEEVDAAAEERRELFEAEREIAQTGQMPEYSSMKGVWEGFTGGADADTPYVDTHISEERAKELLASITAIPEGFKPNSKLVRLFNTKQEMAAGDRPLDWATAEGLAFATLVADGHKVRITGQDAERGTFSHRHAVLHDNTNGERYRPLSSVEQAPGLFEVHNSPLSEIGVMGFEYGYSLDAPDALILWEAQFGDFANTAQVIIDNFISASEMKWNRLTGITLLLPHGWEGQGPEHSSARLERFLQLCAEDNMVVAYPSTPAQYFHLLRRQYLRKIRKPLIVMTPKSILRLPEAASPIADFTKGTFQRVITDNTVDAKKVKTVMFASGKITYELAAEREKLGRDDVAIVRVEQLYPLSEQDLADGIAQYPTDAKLVWVQEEPENNGAWPHIVFTFRGKVENREMDIVARPMVASPAPGSNAAHLIEQRRVIEKAFEQ